MATSKKKVRVERITYDRHHKDRDAKVVSKHEIVYPKALWNQIKDSNFLEPFEEFRVIDGEDSKEPVAPTTGLDLDEVKEMDYDELKSLAQELWEAGNYEDALPVYERIDEIKPSAWSKGKIKSCKAEVENES